MRPVTRAALSAALLFALPLATGPASGHAAERPAVAAARPFGTATSQARMPTTLNEPLGLSLPGLTPRRTTEPAPVPNRDIEAPRERVADSLTPAFEPMLLPPERRQGATFGREHLRETGPDRPFDTIVPGARLRIPFEGGSGR